MIGIAKVAGSGTVAFELTPRLPPLGIAKYPTDSPSALC
jgi:hypothetical protein